MVDTDTTAPAARVYRQPGLEPASRRLIRRERRPEGVDADAGDGGTAPDLAEKEDFIARNADWIVGLKFRGVGNNPGHAVRDSDDEYGDAAVVDHSVSRVAAAHVKVGIADRIPLSGHWIATIAALMLSALSQKSKVHSAPSS